MLSAEMSPQEVIEDRSGQKTFGSLFHHQGTNNENSLDCDLDVCRDGIDIHCPFEDGVINKHNPV